MSGVRRVIDPDPDGPELAPLRDPLRPKLLLSSWQGDRQLTAAAALDGERFVLSVTFVHEAAVAAQGRSTGPAWALVDELWRLVPTAGSADAVLEPADHDLADEEPLPAPCVEFGDLLVLCDMLRRDETEVLAVALDDLGLADVPRWVRSAATSTTGGVTVAVDPGGDRRPLTIVSALATADGWWRLAAHPHEQISAAPLSAAMLRDELLDAAVVLTRPTGAGARAVTG
ncbi:hypothetical protein FB554_3265 [Barrientosiimonas humi]|uniref:Uncharacterized protein n=1 Tax=Barrientosiimonas humi TaxID=999931 RepID=A0A542WZF3_9MICO|nr:hypothetical protein [Barrientosiimonas humi]TQL28955.1 hypothetical protein FB554_3265 [Barrientosiimonas humi]CAG7571370.1 hypothetical protein BH39T_PBIAJDOK_00333 [Barrientosiimonas humi]